MPVTDPDFPDILQHFELTGHVDGAAPHGSGHINDTWLIRVNHFDSRKRYVLQRVNNLVFPDPLAVMENIDRIARHMQSLPETRFAGQLVDQPVFAPIPSRDGEPCWQDAGGNTWRLWPYIYGASTVDSVQSAAQAREAARAFGMFQGLLQDLPGPPLKETIAGFHDTVARFAHFRSALEEDSHDRARDCPAEIEFAFQCEPFVQAFCELTDTGVLPARIAHNDAKINNVMLNDETGAAVCVIDLDTVMPGLSLHDFGDLVRTMTTSAAEDQSSDNEVALRLDYYEAVADGYLESARTFLTGDEIQNMPAAGRILTFETGLRFLTDHLTGDQYFRISRDNHNLDRCKTQFALVRSITGQLDAMSGITEKLAN